jgi:hypothetical protein
MKFFTVCTLPKFHPHHVYKLLAQLHMFYTGPIEFYVYTDRPEEFDDRVIAIPINHNKCVRQWYKIDFFGPDIVPDVNEPVVVIDVSWSIIKNIDHLIDTPVPYDSFLSISRWWRASDDPLPISGGFYKFTPASCYYMWETFYKDPDHWQQKYKNPDHPFSVQGEQDFVFEHASMKHKMVVAAGYKFARIMTQMGDEQYKFTLDSYGARYQQLFGEPYQIDGQWNDRIIMVQS